MISDLEKALTNGVAPWKDIEYRCKDFWIFNDPAVPAKGYLCFVPTSQDTSCLIEAYRAAYKWGYEGLILEKWQGFNIVQCVDKAAGQLVDYPHIHMIPRYVGDLSE